MVRSLQRATVKLLELAVLEPIPGPKPLLAVFLPQRRNYLRNSLQTFYCTDAVLQHRCLKQVPRFEPHRYFSFANEMEE